MIKSHSRRYSTEERELKPHAAIEPRGGCTHFMHSCSVVVIDTSHTYNAEREHVGCFHVGPQADIVCTMYKCEARGGCSASRTKGASLLRPCQNPALSEGWSSAPCCACFLACRTTASNEHLLIFYKIILTTSAASSTNLGSTLMFASCVLHRSPVFSKFHEKKTTSNTIQDYDMFCFLVWHSSGNFFFCRGGSSAEDTSYDSEVETFSLTFFFCLENGLPCRKMVGIS